MLDQIRHNIQARLDDLLAEADNLRHALAALGSSGSAARSATAPASASVRAPRRSSPPSGTSAKTVTARRPRASVPAAPTSPPPAPAAPSSTAGEADGRPRTRAASGVTKAAVLAALADGSAMTAGEVAGATGLARASVSTTLSKLSKAGAVSKAARGYQLVSDTVAPNAPAAASGRAKEEPPAA
jgi:DNA-binding transcriptional ArsR family regulator